MRLATRLLQPPRPRFGASPPRIPHVRYWEITSNLPLIRPIRHLLIGVSAGLAFKILLHWIRGAAPTNLLSARIDRETSGRELRLTLRGAAAFPSLLKLRAEFDALDSSVEHVIVDLSEVRLVDHTFLSRLESMAAELGGATLAIEGLETMRASSKHPHAVRRRVVGS